MRARGGGAKSTLRRQSIVAAVVIGSILVLLTFVLNGWLTGADEGDSAADRLRGGRGRADGALFRPGDDASPHPITTVRDGQLADGSSAPHNKAAKSEGGGGMSIVAPAAPVHSAWSQLAAGLKFGTELHTACRVCKANDAYMRGRDTVAIMRAMLVDERWGLGPSQSRSYADGAMDDERLVTEVLAGSKQPFFCEGAFQKRVEAQYALDAADGNARFSFSPSAELARSLALGPSDPAKLPQEANAAAIASVPLVLCAIGQRFEGPGGQSYVLESIRQWRLFHPPQVSTVYLVIDADIGARPDVQAVIGDEVARGTVKLFDPKSLLTADWRGYFKTFYIQGYMHPGGSRKTGNQHFNQYVSERFFAIEALMRREGLRHIIHMENDIMVYGSLLPTVRAAAACGHGLATTVVHAKGVIPSVLYVRGPDDMRHFNWYLNEFLSCGIGFGKVIEPAYANDMTYLMNYYQLFGARRLGLLPSWAHRKGEVCTAEYMDAAASSQSSSSTSSSSGVTLTPPHEPSLFDVASFGQWYSFAVQRNRTRPPLHIRNAMRGRYIDATPPAHLSWGFAGPADGSPLGDGESQQQRRLLVPRWNGYRLLTLHIHAKNLDRFRSAGESHYARGAVEGGGRGELSEIYQS